MNWTQLRFRPTFDTAENRCRGHQGRTANTCLMEWRDKDTMSSSTVITSTDTTRQPIAPWWHTVLVLVTLALVSVASWYQHSLANAHIPGLSFRLSGYVTVLIQEWFLVLLIWWALRRRGLSINSLVSGRWQTLGGFFKDLGLAAAFLVVEIPLIGILGNFVGANANISKVDITPKTLVELAVWLMLATTAGFCEEIVFRGYLTQQFSSWTGSRFFAVFLQGVVFGLAHGFYGKGMVVIVVHGWLLGALAYWRKSLRPGMLAHGLQDSIGGIVAFFS
jgi:membrane protease YdiL (CAAX protease family)